jgi:hypothetical protein
MTHDGVLVMATDEDRIAALPKYPGVDLIGPNA